MIKKLTVLLWMVVLLIARNGFASVILEVEDGKQAIVEVSGRDLNMIKTNHTEVEVYTNSKALDVSVNGGNVFIGWKDQNGRQPESIFIGESYSLTLVPKGIPSETIILKDISVKYLPPQEQKTDSDKKQKTDYLTELKSLIKHMYTGQQPDGFTYVKMNKKIPRWQSVDYVLVGSFLGAKYRGDVYSITNLTDKTLHIAQNDLYEPGVLAVSIDNQDVLPGGTTAVFIVRNASKDN